MYDYSQTPRYNIEFVDYDLEIAGVRLENWYYSIAGIPLVMFFFGPFIAFPLALVIIIISKKLYTAELRGEPLSFHPKFQRTLRRFPRLFSYLAKLEQARPEYRT